MDERDREQKLLATNKGLCDERFAGMLREKRYREALGGLQCMFDWASRRRGDSGYPRCSEIDIPDAEPLPEHAWCPNCRIRAEFTDKGRP